MKTIKQIRELLLSRRISCVELTSLYLDAIEGAGRSLNAYITTTPEVALEAAKAADRKIDSGEALSPVEGIPFILKDNICTKGIPTTCASRMLKDHIPIYDAEVWSRLKNSGAVMLGKGNMDEFAMGSTCETSFFGTVKNPHDPDRVAGGSSGGPAAAVAAGLAVFGIGSDTGGSIRQPASFCGVTGLKPTYGAVSRRGLIAYASSLDQIGPITACAEDAATVFDTISGVDAGDMTSRETRPVLPALTGSVADMRIGVAREFFADISPEIGKAVESAIKTFEKLGARIVPVDFPMLKYCLPAYYIIACAEASSNLGRYDGLRYGYAAEDCEDLDSFICRTRTEGFGEEVKRRIMLGTYVLSSGYYDEYYRKALNVQSAIRRRFDEVFAECDCLLSPTVPTTAFGIDSGLDPVEIYQTDICTVPVNVAGLPAISVPCGFSGEGLPIGMQVIGRPFREPDIINAALAFERETAMSFIRDTGLGVSL